MNAELRSPPTLRNLPPFLHQRAPFCNLPEGNILPELHSSHLQSKHQVFSALKISFACVSAKEGAGQEPHTGSGVSFPSSHSSSLQPGCPPSGLPRGPFHSSPNQERMRIDRCWRNRGMVVRPFLTWEPRAVAGSTAWPVSNSPAFAGPKCCGHRCSPSNLNPCVKAHGRLNWTPLWFSKQRCSSLHRKLLQDLTGRIVEDGRQGHYNFILR